MRTKILKTVAVAGMIFAVSAAAQEADTAYVEFLVNVDAAVTATRGGDTVSMAVTADEEQTLAVPLGGSSSVWNRGGARGRMNAPVVTGSRGNITLRLPSRAYRRADISLHAVNGRRILSGRAAASEMTSAISRKNVAAGVYLLSIKGIKGNAFTTRLTHRGGNMNINMMFGSENISPERKMTKSATTEDWTITVSAAATGGYVDSTYTLNLVSGTENARQVITLGGAIEGISFQNYPRFDGSTSTNPLNCIVTAKLLNLKYEWRGGTGGRDVEFVNPYYTNPSGDIRSKVQCNQTHNAIINLIDDKADIIIVARRMSADEARHADSVGVTLIETPIAIDALDFIINSQNSVNSLTVEQIQDIYLENITNWNEVGGADDTIIPFIRNANSGSQEMMNEVVMQGTGVDNWEVAMQDADNRALWSMIAVYEELQSHTNGICFTPHYYREYMVHVPSYVKGIAVNGITPARNSIADRTYPFVADVYVSIRSDLSHDSMAYKIYEWLQTRAGKSAINESGYVPN